MLSRNRWKPILIAAAALAAVGAAVAACLMYEPAIAPIQPPAPASIDRELALRGARVVALGDCAVCHTAPGGKPYAGGLPLSTPFGTLYTTNITPDAQTGIGSWSLDAFRRALRRGIARDGHQLYPAFPYVHYTRMSDDDIAAAYAFLMRRDPVVAKAPDNDLIFPLNFRQLVAFWNVLFLRPGPDAPDPAQSVAWNRGRELVTGLGHCAACHSPLNPIGAESWGKALHGGVVDGWEAPSLVRLSRARVPWTEADLVTYLRTGMSARHGAAAGPMLPVTQELATVPLQDVQAMATYLFSLQQPAGDPAPSHAAEVDRQAIARGAVLFRGACASCHGEKAPMQSVGGRPGLATSSAVQAATPRNVIQMMLLGVPWQGEQPMHYMPAFGATFDDAQLADLAMYLRATYSTLSPWQDVPQAVAAIRKGDATR
ncbi:c-type cytochrome [Cupriavidus agavae]|uniref:Mono/diheme cytochrome c family protein n=1 Tax=Cupriavidus agavae TaxID=1001822 RepID=A0A4Q7RVH2_9BURK|nr:c-type cytochrome [Cupriavidus agavae]RZT36710.1 mono/diheme cytochrome c family protein [Cupriavidus agavae]